MTADPFPYVQDCPDCSGGGWQYLGSEEIQAWGSESVKFIPARRVICVACNGRGRIIPPEWTQRR